MKKLIIIFATLILTLNILEAQVKRQYRNAESTKTVMVVKVNDNTMSDIDLLNSQFNLDEVSMSDEIQLTKEQLNVLNDNLNNQKKVNTITASTPKAPMIEKARIVKATEINKKSTALPITIAQTSLKPANKAEMTTAPISAITSKSNDTSETSISTTSTNNTNKENTVLSRSNRNKVSSSSFKKKKKIKRVRLKKRNKVKKRKYSTCYRF